MALIELTNIHKYYNHSKNSEVHALKGIDLTVENGEMLAIMGHSGSGKSTLLHIIGCLDDFQEGDYRFDGEQAKAKTSDELAMWRNKKIGFVLQDFGLILSKTARENIAIPLMFDKSVQGKDIVGRVKNALEAVGLTDKGDVKVSELSGGQKQRIAIARAIVNQPRCILADEPTGALDTATSKEIMDLFLSINKKGTTVIIVTHDIDVASKCDRIINLKDGKIVP